MRKISSLYATVLSAALTFICSEEGSAQALAQPPGTNLTFGDVTHGTRAQSASNNPAAAAADLARQGAQARTGGIVNAAFGVEYGNIQEIWDFYDDIAMAYKPGDPDPDNPTPGQLPELKPDYGIDLDQIWDLLDPELQSKVSSIAEEVARQGAILAVIASEGYGKAWVTADAPFAFATERWGGAWTLQLHSSGTARAFGIVQPIEFSEENARTAIQDWLDTTASERPPSLDVGGQVKLLVSELGDVRFALQNDSLIASKASRTTSLSAGYSRAAWSNDAGTLYLGGEAHLYLLELSRYAVRFGDITNSEELFDSIRNADSERDTRLGIDIGALWVSNRYQLGAQLTNLNEPQFTFPAISIDSFTDTRIIERLQRERLYRIDRQLKLEASLFSESRQWSWHLGLDANAARDPVGDEFQWLTAAVGYGTGSGWVPSVRVGYRKNLAGTEKTYASVGMTLFKYLNLDIASALDTTRINGTTLPEAVMASLGFVIPL